MSDRTVYIAVTPAMRRVLAAMAENLVEMLDQIDGDENMEEPDDLEPSLGWTGQGRGAVGLDWSIPHDQDLEPELGGGIVYDAEGRTHYDVEEQCEDEGAEEGL